MNVSGSISIVKRTRGDRYYARWRAPGLGEHGTRRCLGYVWAGEHGRPPEGYLTKKMADAELQAILTDARRGVGVHSSKGATLADAASEYLHWVTEVKQLDPKTLTDYRGVIEGEGYLLDEFGSMKLEAITPDHIDVYKERLIAAGELSNRTIVRHLTVLGSIFRRAKRTFGLRDNPAELVEKPSVTYTGEFQTLDGAEIECLAANAESEQDAAIYKAAAYTGLRQGELLALTWDCVDFVDGLVHVRRNYTNGAEKIPKGKRVRSVPLIPEVIDVLATLKDREHFTSDTDLVFCSEAGRYLDPSALRRRFKAALDRAGLPRVRFHDLRHIFASTAITRLDPVAVQAYCGHQHASTTARYLHHQPRREDAAKLAEAFGCTQPGTNSPTSKGTRAHATGTTST